MTTIGLSFEPIEPSTSAAPPQDTEVETVVQPEQRKKVISKFVIPSTIGFGLLLTFGYVGGRILSASAGVPSEVHPVTVPSPPQKVAPAAVAAKKSAFPEIVTKAAVPKPTVETPAASLNLITPGPGEMYLQLAALPPKMAIQFIDNLKKMNVDAHIAPGPAADTVRVLTGPFASSDLLKQAQAKLDAMKIVSMARDY